MKQSTAAMLSGHLLQEASKFHMYPARVYRTRSNLDAQKIHDTILAMLVEWHETFAPWPQNDPDTAVHERCDKILTSPVLLDEFYCRDLLKEVPAIVGRTVKLSHLTLSGISGSEFVYLREAAKCYIHGLPQAAVALARAALEDCLRKKFAKFWGKMAVAEKELKDLIDELARTKGLSREGRDWADKVREAGNAVLHAKGTDLPDPLTVIEMARKVILELSRR
jgi:Domain of unknown function (DUF4145)